VVTVAQGDVWWADLTASGRSEPAFRRPVVVVQADAVNRSRLRTVVCIPMTSNLRWANAPGNVLVEKRRSGLPTDSVANVSQIVSLDRDVLIERAGRLPRAILELVLDGIDVILGR
jgi:mRNA interferase MazF